jgi:hypothetical protein
VTEHCPWNSPHDSGGSVEPQRFLVEERQPRDRGASHVRRQAEPLEFLDRLDREAAGTRLGADLLVAFDHEHLPSCLCQDLGRP